MVVFYVFYQIDQHVSGLQFSEHMKWNLALGIACDVGLDGFSLPMMILACILRFVAILASRSIKDRTKGNFLLLLLLQTTMLGDFVAQD